MVSKRQVEKGAVIITGASTGIGHATALLLDQEGYQVFAGVRREQDAIRLQKKSSGHLKPIILDITVVDHILAAKKLIEESGFELTGLINNAGIAQPGPLEITPIEFIRHQLEVNLTCHIEMIQTFLPLLRQAGGRIINVGSANGRVAFPFFGAYAASKFGMEGLTDSLRRELRAWKIHVSLIEPGVVEAAIWDHAKNSYEKMRSSLSEEGVDLYGDKMEKMTRFMLEKGRGNAIKPEKLAEVILSAMQAKKPKARYRRGPGSGMAVIGACLPDPLLDWILERAIDGRLPSKLIGW